MERLYYKSCHKKLKREPPHAKLKESPIKAGKGDEAIGAHGKANQSDSSQGPDYKLFNHNLKILYWSWNYHDY